MYLLPLLEVVGKRPHRSEYILPSLVVMGSTFVQYNKFVLILSSRYLSEGFSLVYCNPCILLCGSPIVVFINLSCCLFISFSLRPGQVFRKPCLIALRILDIVGPKSAACKYWASYGFEVCTRMLFTTFSDCCGPRGIFHIPVFLSLVPLIIYFPFFWIEIACLSNVMVHPASHKTPNDINGDVFIFGKMWICLAILLRPDSFSVAMCVNSIVLPSGSLALI